MQCKDNLQVNILFASAKAGRSAHPAYDNVVPKHPKGKNYVCCKLLDDLVESGVDLVGFYTCS